ncbi:ATP/GTP-binding protein, partial [Streptomyces sp. BF23-18]
MDASTPSLTDQPGGMAVGRVLGLGAGLVDAANWLCTHWYLVPLAAAALWAAGEVLVRRLALKASAERMALELEAAGHFDPGLEEIFRRGVQL